MKTTDGPFECWAIVEVMGHRQYAGHVSEQTIGGASFVRVDVPEIASDLPAFTKLLSAGAIYAISPCTEATAKAFAASARKRSFDVYELPKLAASYDAREYDEEDDE